MHQKIVPVLCCCQQRLFDSVIAKSSQHTQIALVSTINASLQVILFLLLSLKIQIGVSPKDTGNYSNNVCKHPLNKAYEYPLKTILHVRELHTLLLSEA